MSILEFTGVDISILSLHELTLVYMSIVYNHEYCVVMQTV